MIFASIVCAIAMFPITIGQCTTRTRTTANRRQRMVVGNITSVPAPRSIASRKGNHLQLRTLRHPLAHQIRVVVQFVEQCVVPSSHRRRRGQDSYRGHPSSRFACPRSYYRCSRKNRIRLETSWALAWQELETASRLQHKFMFVHLHLHNSEDGAR